MATERKIADNPSDRSYWAVPNCLAVGAQPSDKDLTATRLLLASLLSAGIDTFVDLRTDEERQWDPSGNPVTLYEPIATEFAKSMTPERSLVFLRLPMADGKPLDDQVVVKFVVHLLELVQTKQ